MIVLRLNEPLRAKNGLSNIFCEIELVAITGKIGKMNFFSMQVSPFFLAMPQN